MCYLTGRIENLLLIKNLDIQCVLWWFGVYPVVGTFRGLIFSLFVIII